MKVEKTICDKCAAEITGDYGIIGMGMSMYKTKIKVYELCPKCALDIEDVLKVLEDKLENKGN
jgi:hypothetical protein